MNKIINILKPTGMTSHDVVSCVRRTLNMKKVGHTGTLDPDAAGVLPICLGRATKVSELILNKDKSYICELTLGIETDTYDSSGTILYRNDNLDIEESKIREAFKSQEGEIKQLPPVYSALKVNGKKMCDLARKGKADLIDIKPRKVNIKEIDILNISKNKITFYVKCSKGTYVRSICHDIGEYLNCGGHMSFLLRTSSGKFNLENAITLEELEELKNTDSLDEYLYDIDYVLDNLPEVNLNPSAKRYYMNGGVIDSRRFVVKKSQNNDKENDLVRVYCENIFIGVGKILKDNNIMTLKSDKLFI
ncbi:tRNA pseudouridine(55) synthase TruB [Intestinibacter bartlettii]|uniref:tRNA pseudouridine synthase B n=1 Tax=Intestinibacter bartlettii TaxID=261299 RepID=A0ABS6DT40_9FIRM|nr:tRNA pseudouridine(55) synthase TruB [Intestinibacter bartlettii]MBU5334939.1 tRNA pseudouridine(55) synthase TruB [Intestinibacter bartlettii]